MVNEKLKQMDAKDFELPDTLFIKDIESRVFQSIVLQCLSKIEGVVLLEGNLIDDLLRREGIERVKGISIEQDQKNHAVKIKVEINIVYGTPLSEKGEEIQTKIVEEISRLTGIHVAVVHVIFKNMVSPKAIL